MNTNRPICVIRTTRPEIRARSPLPSCHTPRHGGQRAPRCGGAGIALITTEAVTPGHTRDGVASLTVTDFPSGARLRLRHTVRDVS
jgi:hypothetical protein